MSSLYNKLFAGDITTICFPKDFDISEIYSFALMSIINRGLALRFINTDEAKELKKDNECLLVDIGDSDFNSNSAFFDTDKYGKLTSFRKLWKELGADIMGTKELADMFYEEHIVHIENDYGTDDPYNVSHIMLTMMPMWNESVDKESLRFSFLQASNFASVFLSYLIKAVDSRDKALDIVYHSIDENGSSHVLYFDRWNSAIDLMEAINKNIDSDKQIYFVVYQEDDGTLTICSFKDCNGITKTIDPDKLKLPKDELLQYLKSLV